MFAFIEEFATYIWSLLRKTHSTKPSNGVTLGHVVRDGEVIAEKIILDDTQRTMHVATLGMTGSGKSSFLKSLAVQDIEANRGFLYFDLHGDSTPFLLKAIAKQELKSGRPIDEQTIVVAPGDPDCSVGINPLHHTEPDFVRIAEFTKLLMQRWGLERFGARTDELLRNTLYVLSANGLTLLELAPLLTLAGFRRQCLKRTPNAEVRQYFELRYDTVSEAMQATMREPILNRTSSFTADPNFRVIVGQAQSTFSMVDAMDDAKWVIADIPKGRLGEQALTLGGMLFAMARNALFGRKRRTAWTIYVDEVQNFLANDSGIETVLSEARKFGVSIVSANQYLSQYSDEMRAAVLSVGTKVFFQLSPPDATQIAQTLDGGKSLAERLKNLRPRHFIVKSGATRWSEGRVGDLHTPRVNYTDLLNRSRLRYAQPLALIDEQIAERHKLITLGTGEVRDVWE